MKRWSWAARASDLCLVAVCTFVLVNSLGQTRLPASSHEISCRSSAKVSDLGSKLTGRLRHFDGRGGMIDDKNTELK